MSTKVGNIWRSFLFLVFQENIKSNIIFLCSLWSLLIYIPKSFKFLWYSQRCLMVYVFVWMSATCWFFNILMFRKTINKTVSHVVNFHRQSGKSRVTPFQPMNRPSQGATLPVPRLGSHPLDPRSLDLHFGVVWTQCGPDCQWFPWWGVQIR